MRVSIWLVTAVLAVVGLIAVVATAQGQTAPHTETAVVQSMEQFITQYGGGDIVEIKGDDAVKRFMDVVNEIPPVVEVKPGDRVLTAFLPNINIGLMAVISTDGMSYEEGRFTLKGEIIQRARIAAKGEIKGEEKL